MNYVEAIKIGGATAAQIPCVKGNGAPTTATEGAVGCLYMDIDTGDMYKCIAVNNGVYTWVGCSAKDAVLYTKQKLSEEEKAIARENIGAVASVNGIAPDENGNVKIGIGNIGGTTTVVEKTFKVWGKNATNISEDDVIATATGRYDKEGKIVSTNAFCCTKPMIEIDENSVIFAHNLYDFAEGYTIVFLDTSGNLISGVGTGDTSNRISGNQVVPPGARYVGVSLLVADPSMYCQITTKVTITDDDLDDQLENLRNEVEAVKNRVSDTVDQLDSLVNETQTLVYADLLTARNGYYDVNGIFQSSSGWRCSEYIPVSEGDKITAKLTTYSTTSALAYFDMNHNFISGVVGETWSWDTSVYPFNETVEVPTDAHFVRVSIFVADYATEQFVTVDRDVLRDMKNNLYRINGKPLNVLVLGDSYSEIGGWIQAMKDVIEIDSIVNLGVSSATIKDKYADRVQYPYSDRPKTQGGGGNTNTLSSQIQLLKRRMLGQDLDEGETQLYVEPTEYPNVIIIEGGMNDGADTDVVVNTYQEQFLVSKTAYYKLNSSSPVKEQTVYVKPSLDEIDRTCFAGAYRYLCEELINLFPDAQIFITTASHMNYFTVNPNIRYGKIAEQQRKCADIMSYAVIDWHAEGNLNTMMIELNGSGTENNPYTPIGGDGYTSDLLHPNDIGAKRYGRLAGKVIQQKYLGLS